MYSSEKHRRQAARDTRVLAAICAQLKRDFQRQKRQARAGFSARFEVRSGVARSGEDTGDRG
jgi:hypothetical protein